MGRIACLLCLAILAGCHTFGPVPTETPNEPAPVPGGPLAEREEYSVLSRSERTTPATDSLAEAADCLERGDSVGATRHLARHVAQHPDQVVFRLQLAELYFRKDELAEAARHYESGIACAQSGPPAVRKQLIHCHTRLMEIAQARSDEYGEYLHRGVGLLLVGEQLTGQSDSSEVERLLCKAATALKRAQELRAGEARPAYYLHRVWERLDQPRAADRAIAQARAAAPFSELTPSEASAVARAR